MNELNAALRNVTSAVLSPFSEWSPLVPLVAISIVLGVVMAVVFRFTSPQRRLRRVADRSRAEVLAIKLFQDEPRVTFRALGRLLRYSALRLAYSLPPMLVMLAPFVLLLAHLAVWYEHRPLKEGEAAVVELQLAEDAWTEHRAAGLVVPVSVAVETSPLRDERQHTVAWRIRVREGASADVQWQLGAERVAKHVAVATHDKAFCAASARRAGPDWWDQLLYPGEERISADVPVCGIEIGYPPRSTPVFGWNVPWWATLVIVSILAALIARPFVKVQF